VSVGRVLAFPVDRVRGAGPEYDVTKAELAQRWSVSQRWIEMRMRDSGLPHFKDRHSRFVRFPLADCERWRAERMRRSA